MVSDESREEMLQEAILEVSEEYDADILCYFGNLFPNFDRKVLRVCRRRGKKRPNVLLVLCTPGGSADSAYRVSHCLQRQYSQECGGSGKFMLYTPEFCKSAGTILALGADEIIMSQVAELGPIDVQLQKEDEVGEWASGLNSTEALLQL